MKNSTRQFGCMQKRAKDARSFPSGESLYQKVKETSPVPIDESHVPTSEWGAWGAYYPSIRQIGLAPELGDPAQVQVQLDGIGLAGHPDTKALLDNFKPYITAHEIGHANFHASPVGRVLSHPYMVTASQSSLPTRLSVWSGFLAPTRATRALGVLTGTALGARAPLSEYIADRHALRTLQGMGAHPSVRDLYRGEMNHNVGTTSGEAVSSLMLGLASMGARELLNHVTKEGSVELPEIASANALYDRVAKSSPFPISTEQLRPGVVGVYRQASNSVHLSPLLDKLTDAARSLASTVDTNNPDDVKLLQEIKQNLGLKANTLAHEIGHGQWGATPIGHVTQSPLVHGTGQVFLPHALSVWSGAFLPTRATRAAGVLGGALWSAAPALNEYMADHNGWKILQQAGASAHDRDLWHTSRAQNMGSYLKHVGVNAGLGLASMGVRELYDKYKARNEKQAALQTKKFGPFTFKIDRPAGYVKEWPQPDGSIKSFTYPVDYGYWPKIKGEDGEGLDAFVGDDEKGHLESFQKLNPDGSLDETKFLLGVSDAEREKIYKLYGTEVHARRVYETFDDVQKALDTFKTKMHKSDVSCEKKLADFHAVKMARVRPEVKQYRRALQLMGNDAWDFHGTGNLSGLAGTGQIYPGKLRAAHGFGAYFSRGGPLPEYWYGRRAPSLESLKKPDGSPNLIEPVVLAGAKDKQTDKVIRIAIASNRRDGGVVLPSAHVEASGGRSIGTPIISPLPYILSEKPVPLVPGGYVVHTDGGTAARAAMDKIQREYRLRPIQREPFTKAFNEYVKERTAKADARLTRNLLIGGGLLAAGGLAYGAYKHFSKEDEPEKKLADFHAVKTARVRPEVKQYRRALQVLNNPEYDFHGTANMGAIAQTGVLSPGPTAMFGKGVYLSRGEPEIAYWHDQKRMKAPFDLGLPHPDGGFVIPAKVTAQHGGTIRGGYSPPYVVVPGDLPLGKGQYVIPTYQHANAAAADIQRKYHLRPISDRAFDAALATHAGTLPVEQAQQVLRNPAVLPLAQSGLSNLHKGLLAVGGLAAGAGLAYGGYRAYKHFKDKRETEPKLADFHAVNLPADLSAQVGTQQYYLSRAKDFRDRHPELRAPDYYHDYGDKYVHRYTHDLSPKLSDKGQSWVSDTLTGLQRAIEDKRAKDPHAFDKLERDPDAFRRFAFGSHPRAYLSAGLKDLPFKDVVRIGLTPDVKDILTPNGVTQVARTAKGYVKHASNVFNALNWVPEPYQNRVQTPYQMLTSARNTPALTATQPNLRMLQVSRENSQY